MNVGIRNLVIYPIKSAAGIDLEEAVISPSGLSFGNYHDHQFMIVREEPSSDGLHHFVTQRKHVKGEEKPGFPELARVKPYFVDDTLGLTWLGDDSIQLERPTRQVYPVFIWGDVLEANDLGDEAADWLSDHLGERLRLVQATPDAIRPVRKDYHPNDGSMKFQDGYPIHWFSIESVYELSDIAGKTVPWRRFRPQIVVEGMPAQYEHKIYDGELAEIPFVDPKPCDRCPVTTIDQETGNPMGAEPLKSLGTYKRWRDLEGKGKVIFGENMLPLGEGVVRIGDKMIVTSERNPPLVYG